MVWRENREERLQYMREYYAKNKEKAKERRKVWYEKNKIIHLENTREYHHKNRELISKKRKEKLQKDPTIYRRRRLRKKYGITHEQFLKMSETQGNKCAACLRRTILVVDHCHETGKIRGLLCNQCNTAIGLLKESRQRMEALIRYVERPLT